MKTATKRWRAFSGAALTLLALGACLATRDPGNLVPGTVDEDPALPQIVVNGTRLHAEAFGDPAAPIVMVLHGGPGGDYRALLPLRALADDGYRVVFWDQRGTGLSRRHDPGAYTLGGYLEDLRQVVEHYTVTPGQPMVFIGQSWGAMYATWFINEHGDYGGRVRGAILSEPGAFTRPQLDAYVAALRAEERGTRARPAGRSPLRERLSAADHARADELLGRVAHGGRPSERQDPANPAPFWRFGAVVSRRLLELVDVDFDWTTNLSRFPAKVLFLRGERNTVMTLAHQRHLAAAWPRAEIVTISGTGHKLIWEKPDAYLAHARDYFAEIGFDGAKASP